MPGVRCPASDARRIAAIVEYDGSDYAGWQSQAHAASMQDAVAGGDCIRRRRTRSSRSARAAPMPAFTRPARSSTSTPLPSARRARGCSAPTPNYRPPSRCSGRARSPPGFHARHTALRRDLSVLYFELQRPLGAAPDAHRLDPPSARRRGDASRARRRCSASTIFRPFVRSNASRRPASGASRAWWCSGPAIACGSKSRRTRICTTWCAISSGRCSRCSARRIRSPPWGAFLRGANGAWRALPHRPRACTCGAWNILPIHGIPAPERRFC